jgi:hypothetical protein
VLSVLVHACNLSTPEAEAGRLGVPGQPELHSETVTKVNKLINELNSNLSRISSLCGHRIAVDPMHHPPSTIISLYPVCTLSSQTSFHLKYFRCVSKK